MFALLGKIFGVRSVKATDDIQGEFVSLASHQLRTPLTSMRWIMEEIFNEELGPLNETQKQYLEKALTANAGMTELVNDLLNMSRVETGRFSIQPQEVDIKKLVSEIFDEAKSFASAYACELLFDENSQAATASTDKHLLREVLRNLVNNGMKYSDSTKDKSWVKVKIEKDEKNVKIHVIDNGVGIPEKEQAKIFSKFYRAANAIKLAPSGTGLGLYVNQIIIKEAGGKLTFFSKAGAGSTFIIQLPLAGVKVREGDSQIEARSLSY